MAEARRGFRSFWAVLAELTSSADSTVDNRIRRKQLSCPHCPPNKAENAKRKAKHGPKKPRLRNKRR